MGEFWNQKCSDLTKLLWNPQNYYHREDEREEFGCQNPNISFHYYDNKKVKINPKLDFKELPIIDNTIKKETLKKRLIKKEKKIIDKQKDANDNGRITKLQKQQHKLRLEKIDTKLERVDGFIRSRRIRIIPTPAQESIVNIWFHDTTCVYNRLVSHFTQVYFKCEELIDPIEDENNPKHRQLAYLLRENEEVPLNFIKLRNLKITGFTNDYPDTPFCVLADTIKEFVSNVKANVTNLLKNKITEFNFNHRKFDRCVQTITIESKYTHSEGFYKSIIGDMCVATKNDTDFEWGNIEHDYKLVYEAKLGKYYIHAPKYVYPKEINYERNLMATIDPGELMFGTLYGLDHIIEIGKNMRDYIVPKLEACDDLWEKMKKPGKWKYNKKLKKKTKVKKKRLRKAIIRKQKQMENLQKELHYKVAIYLCENYDRIMVTDFSSKNVSSNKLNLDPMIKRVLGKLSHYKFTQRLQQKCEEFGCQYFKEGEAFTSKTCSQCGYVNRQLGRDREYVCPECGNKLGRDINAAINIFLRNHELVLNN